MKKEEIEKLKETEPERLVDFWLCPEFGLCPECENELFYAEGCCYCPACGWSACK